MKDATVTEKGHRIEPPKVIAAWDECETHLACIEKLFVPEAKVTLLVRIPGHDEGDFLLTIDDLEEVKRAIDRALNRPESKRA